LRKCVSRPRSWNWRRASSIKKAIGQVTDAGVRKLLGDLEEVERKHQITAEALEEKITPDVEKKEDEAQRRLFVLQIVQPGLAGLMDGSVSTLAPVFAAAFATKSSHDALLVGLAASIGAGISMAFAEALSDDGSLTGRGRPVLRGAVTGLMTAAGGIGHTLPFLMKDFHVALIAAVMVVAAEFGHDRLDFGIAIWTPRFCPPHFRSWWAACWSLPWAFGLAAREDLDRFGLR